MGIKRDRTPGAMYFFTVVAHGRRPVLTAPWLLDALGQAVADVRQDWPFSSLAWVILPDHMHTLWRLPPGDADHSRRWGEIKRRVSRSVRAAHGFSAPASPSARKRHESGIWQRRYWDHRIRDEDDLRRHVDYIHFNPVKHGLVERAADWPHSSFHAFVRRGWLAPGWGCAPFSGEFGE
jgi:putative transposase